MDLLRKTWVLKGDEFIRQIDEKEKYLAALKKDNAPPYRRQQVEKEINFLVDTYNSLEKMWEVAEIERVKLLMEKMILGNEIRILIRLLTDIRNLSADPERLMQLISKVHDTSAEIMEDNTLLRPDKRFQREVDKYYAQVMKEHKIKKEVENHADIQKAS